MLRDAESIERQSESSTSLSKLRRISIGTAFPENEDMEEQNWVVAEWDSADVGTVHAWGSGERGVVVW